MDHLPTARNARDFDLDDWDDATPFPLSAEQCVALCRGQFVRWDHSIEMLMRLPGRYELLEGWLCVKR